jgi:cephalosporin-C deacetylase
VYFDFPFEQVNVYKPDRQEPDDFDVFWSETITQAREFPLAAQFEPTDYRLQTLDAYDVTFNGYGGQ